MKAFIFTIACVLGSGALTAMAQPTLKIINNTPYSAEISGLVGATASQNPLAPNGGVTEITGTTRWLGHVMLIADGQPGYYDNVVFRATGTQFKAFDLYHKVRIKFAAQRLILEAP